MSTIHQQRQVIYYNFAKTKHWLKKAAKYSIQNGTGTSMPLHYPYRFNLLDNPNSYSFLQYRTCGSNCKLGYFYGLNVLANALRKETKSKKAKELVNELFSFGLRQTIFATCHLGDLKIIKKYFDLAYVIKVPTGYGKVKDKDNYYIYHILILNPYNNSYVKEGGKSIKMRISSKKKEWPLSKPSCELIK